jgi:hypothetical protein
LLGKELWQIGLFGDIEVSRAAFRQLLERGLVSFASSEKSFADRALFFAFAIASAIVRHLR